MADLEDSHSSTSSGSRAAPIAQNRYEKWSDPSNLFRLEPSDNLGTVLVTELLSTENYTTWAR